MEKNKTIVIDWIKVICPNCGKSLDVAIPATPQRRAEILHQRLVELLKKRGEVNREIDRVDKMLKE